MSELDKLLAEPKNPVDWVVILNEARAAAHEAAASHIDKHPNTWYPCGFAWVNIKPARGKLVDLLKLMGMGYTDTFLGGYTVWNPSENSTQWMDAKEEGAKAFAFVLRTHGIKCSVGTRMD